MQVLYLQSEQVNGIHNLEVVVYEVFTLLLKKFIYAVHIEMHDLEQVNPLAHVGAEIMSGVYCFHTAITLHTAARFACVATWPKKFWRQSQ